HLRKIRRYEDPEAHLRITLLWPLMVIAFEPYVLSSLRRRKPLTLRIVICHLPREEVFLVRRRLTCSGCLPNSPSRLHLRQRRLPLACCEVFLHYR
ncbi:hypothetical protein VIGAN_03150700, partial [Vigna angularis var. angularis]